MRTSSLIARLSVCSLVLIVSAAWGAYNITKPPSVQPPTEEVFPTEAVDGEGQSDVLDADLRIKCTYATALPDPEVNVFTHTDAVQGDWMGEFLPEDDEWDEYGIYYFRLYMPNGTTTADTAYFAVAP